MVIVKQSCLLGGTLSFSLGHRVWGIRADNGGGCNKAMSGGSREETIPMIWGGDGTMGFR